MLIGSNALAQTVVTDNKKWGVEAEVFQPFYPTVHILRLQASYSVFEGANNTKGDLLLGMYIRPDVKHDVVEKINEYMLIVGYRHYFWKGLHAEVKSNMGYAWGTYNLIDHRNYETPVWFWEANAGYRFTVLRKAATSFYITPQFGGLGKIIADIGPRGGKPDNFLHGNILIGIQF